MGICDIIPQRANRMCPIVEGVIKVPPVHQSRHKHNRSFGEYGVEMVEYSHIIVMELLWCGHVIGAMVTVTHIVTN